VGFDWEHGDDVISKLHEEIGELERARHGDGVIAEEIGDLLFTVVNLCRHEGLDAEGVLRSANVKFERRFRRLESRIADEGRSPQEMGVEELEKAWKAVKSEEGGT
jgi:uncharacterized protein YabN with tetrapyrrole methylase and pyrophosphatase domain